MIRSGTGPALALGLLLFGAGAHAQALPGIAVAQFDYADSSGEPGDQRALHATRIAAFQEKLVGDLGSQDRYRPVKLECGQGPCSAATENADALIEAARKTGADYLVFGGVHKMSTLIEWAKAEVIDLHTGKLVFDQLLTFRGDSDEAWQRAESFLAQELATAKLAAP